MALALPFAVVCMIMFLGDFVSQKSRGKIPSLLIIAVCFLLGYWTVMPRDILDVTHINQIKNITMLLVLLQVGAMFNLKQLKDEWKAVVVTLFAIAGIVVVAGIGGTLLFGKDMAMVGIPPLTGGGMATRQTGYDSHHHLYHAGVCRISAYQLLLKKRGNPSGQGIPGEYTCPGRSGRGPQRGQPGKGKENSQ